jgi:hypothetical protein
MSEEIQFLGERPHHDAQTHVDGVLPETPQGKATPCILSGLSGMADVSRDSFVSDTGRPYITVHVNKIIMHHKKCVRLIAWGLTPLSTHQVFGYRSISQQRKQ